MSAVAPPVASLGDEDDYDAWSEHESDSSDDGMLDPEEMSNDLSGIEKSKLEHLGLMTKYAPDWTPKEGFREVYQNWRDAILRSFNLKLAQFAPELTEHRRHILIQAFHPNRSAFERQLLGYIRFKWDDKGEGVLEATNFNASLQLWHLSLGGTSKAGDRQQAGQHGEGFKMAALTFRRYPYNYSFRIEASRFRWNFNFNTRRKLVCRLTRVDDQKIKRQRREIGDQPRTTKSRIWSDVSVFIGTLRKGRSSHGQSAKSCKIPLAQFREWLKVTIDIVPPSSTVHTKHGDLIMDPSHANRLYLRGLLLPSGSMSGKKFRYGYNFLEGDTGRDREALGVPGEEARRVANIWADALQTCVLRHDLLAKYTDLLTNNVNKVADVMFDDAKQPLHVDTAKLVWQHMRKINRDGQGRVAFYYNSKDTEHEIHIIEKNLHRHPVPVLDDLWNMLRKHGLCRTPFEEQQHRFSRARPVKVPKDVFGCHIHWFLRCIIRSHSLTRDIGYVFIQGADLGLDVAYFDPMIKIHEKWLTYEATHQQTFCEENDPASGDLFACDHVILWLWELILSQIFSTKQKKDLVKDENWIKSMTRFRLVQVPRRITCLPTNRRGELKVAWESIDSSRHNHKSVKVTLHAEHCTKEPKSSWDYPMNITHNAVENDTNCACPTSFSRVDSSGVTFGGLDPGKNYYPKVCRDAEGSFFGMPPRPIAPADCDSALASSEQPLMSERNTVDSLYADPTPISQPISDGARSPTNDTLNEVWNGTDTDYCDPCGGLCTNACQRANRSAAPNPSTGPTPSLPPVRPSANVEPTAVSKSYIIGDKIEHAKLDWAGGFPGSHDFYRTRNEPNEDVLIVKPKLEYVNVNGKRTVRITSFRQTPKRTNLAT